jgi:hypothetical protein
MAREYLLQGCMVVAVSLSFVNADAIFAFKLTGEYLPVY